MLADYARTDASNQLWAILAEHWPGAAWSSRSWPRRSPWRSWPTTPHPTAADAHPGHHRQPGPARDQGRRCRGRRPAADHRRGQPRPAALLGLLRRAVRHRAHPGQFRTHRPAPALSRRGPTGQRRPAPHREEPDDEPPRTRAYRDVHLAKGWSRRQSIVRSNLPWPAKYSPPWPGAALCLTTPTCAPPAEPRTSP